MFSSRSLLVALLVLGLAVGVDASALVIEWSVGSIIGLVKTKQNTWIVSFDC